MKMNCVRYTINFLHVDVNLCVLTMTAGQAEITALTTSSAQTMNLSRSICSTLTDFSFYWVTESTVSSQISHHKASNFLSVH